MKISTRFSDAIHLLAFISIYQGKKSLTSKNIALSINTSPVMIRQLMSALRKGKLLESRQGVVDPHLTRPAEQISLLDIYFAAEGKKKLFNINYKTSTQDIVGKNIAKTLHKYYQEAEIAAKAKLEQITLADVINSLIVEQKSQQDFQI